MLFRRFVVILVAVASFALVSCSDSGSTRPDLNTSQKIQSDMNSVMTDVMTAPGSTALSNNMQSMEYLPFDLPIKNISGSINRIEVTEALAKSNLVKKVFPASVVSSKQAEHFIFSDWLGTYTFNGYVYDDYGYIIDANWIIEGGSNITVIVPAIYTADSNEFRLVLNNYTDEYIYWYDSEQYPNYDYFPTLIDMEVYSASLKVLDLDFSADWEYMAAMDDVMPKILDVVLVLDPFTLSVTNLINETYFTIDYSMSLEENLETLMSVDALITFTDTTLGEVSEVDLSYGFGEYLIDLWVDVIEMDLLMESEILTVDEQVDALNTGDYIYCNIFENDLKIGELQARKVWDEYEWNDETQDYTGAYVVVPYVGFTDGSEMGEDELAELMGETGMFMK